jgi:uncharacterized membrane protein
MRALPITLLLLSIFASHLALGAELSGIVYTQDLAVAKYSLLLVGSAPPQRIILPEGRYNLTLPPGTYHLRAYYSERGRTYEDDTRLNITGDRAYTYDFLLFPVEENRTEQLPDISALNIPDATKATIDNWAILIIALIAAVVLLLLLLARSKKKKREEQGKEEKGENKKSKEERPEELPADLQSIIAVLKDEDGRTTQKELRKRIPCSEAKMSMMLTELEHKGRITRIKKGRGNLIVFKR